MTMSNYGPFTKARTPAHITTNPEKKREGNLLNPAYIHFLGIYVVLKPSILVVIATASLATSYMLQVS